MTPEELKAAGLRVKPHTMKGTGIYHLYWALAGFVAIAVACCVAVICMAI